METELYYAIQALITLIERTDFTRQVSIRLELGVGMVGFIVLMSLLAFGLGYMIGSNLKSND